MKSTIQRLEEKTDNLKKQILNKYKDNKKLAKQLISGAELNADYRYSDTEPMEKWYMYFVEELDKRI
jgi:hypothetical protein